MAREKTPEEQTTDNERKQLAEEKKKTEERTAGTAQGSKAPGKRNRKTGRCSG